MTDAIALRSNTAAWAAAALALLSVSATSAHADDERRFYASADFGAGFLGSQTLEFDDGSNVSTSDADFNASWTAGATIGYRVARNWALEGEIMYRRNELDSANVAGLGDFRDGDFASLSYGLSALYHFDIGSSGKLSGYAGPGIVYLQEIDIDFESESGEEFEFDADDTAFQFKVGGRYDFSERWFVDAVATYLVADGIKMRGTADRRQTVTSDYDHWKLGVGVGFRF